MRRKFANFVLLLILNNFEIVNTTFILIPDLFRICERKKFLRYSINVEIILALLKLA